MTQSSGPKKAWGGVFQEPTDARVEAFSESVSFDRRLADDDIDGSIAHARMLASVGLMTVQEADAVAQALEEIRGEIHAGRFEFTAAKEDIHLHIESGLTARLGDTGRKLHTARSRNDQVATDLRLFCRRAIDRLDAGMAELQRSFLGLAEREQDLVIPAYTHLRRAQPVLAAHQLLGWCEKLARDRDRLADCRRRTNILPLGSAALAGTSLPIDREHVREALGFEAVAANSLDAASDRDFGCELAFVVSLTGIHLSQWAEEWIIWSTHEFGLLRLPEGFCTGSSIMPQKINPDVLELVRGKSARLVGNLQQLLVLLKGLPTAYNRDLQEDKEAIFDSIDTLEAVLGVAAPLVAGARFDRERVAASIDQGHLDATSLMEALIGQGVPQRTAHETVGLLVRRAMTRGVSLAELTDEEIAADYAGWNAALRGALGASRAVERMQSFGSTAPAAVADQIAAWRHRLGVAN
ncbi:MAG: argininosuccinate lyase [Planctomycetota bacterium]|jgi:argininosuccinate lyase|nr:argininosuccinate lyase [Planctomycetota bacterium]